MEDKLSVNVVAGDEVKKLVTEIRRQYVVWIFMSVAFNLIAIALAVHRYLRFSGKEYHKWQNIVSVKVLPLISLVHALIALGAYIIYYNAINIQKRSVFSGEQELFNKSFELNKKANYFAIVSAFINFFTLLFYFFSEVVFETA